MNVMWTKTAFWMYMGQYDAVTSAEFEPARRREELLGNLADTQCEVDTSEGRPGPFGVASAALHALTGRRFARG